LHIALNTSSKTSTPQSDDGHGKTEAAETTKIKNASDKNKSQEPQILSWRCRRDWKKIPFPLVVKPSSGPSNLTPHLNSMSVKKRKNEEPQIGLLLPPSRQEPSATLVSPYRHKRVVFILISAHRLAPPLTWGSPGVRPSPFTSCWKSRQIGPS
jgi:hypothetical protein